MILERFKYFKKEHLKISIPILIVLILLLIIYSKTGAHPKEQHIPLLHDGSRLIVPEDSPLRHEIKIKVVHKELIRIPFALPSMVQAIPANTVKVFPPLAGHITCMYKQLGEFVKKGEPLYKMDSADLAQAFADYGKANAEYEYEQQTYKRQQALMASKIGSMHDLQEAQHDYNQALSELNRTKSRLVALNVKNVDVNKNEGSLVIRSPLTGYVTAVNAGRGSFWNDLNAEVMTVADLTQVYVIANAQEKNLPELYVGQQAQVMFDAYPEPQFGQVKFMNQVLNPDTRTVEIGMIFKNPTNQLKPNMFAKSIFLSKPHQRIFLPLTAVIQRGFDSLVFVEVAAWQFEPRRVVVGAQLDDYIEIISGLNENDRAVYVGGIVLND